MITIELYNKNHERVKVENFKNQSIIFALALGENWELAEEGNYWVTIM